ncbi:MAG: M1 family aminopeptidase [Gemmataceae bacterium]
MSRCRKGMGIWVLLPLLCMARPSLATEPIASARSQLARIIRRPDWLPKYHLAIQLDVERHVAKVHMWLVWKNRHERAAKELVFNAHSHYQVPKSEIGLFAKTLEILRMSPGDGLDTGEPPLEITKATCEGFDLPVNFEGDTNTTLILPLPRSVAKGESVTLEMEFLMHLPQKQGRWGQWKGVTYLSNWLPVLAYYDEKGWQPTPFIPWHQPFFNESCVYQVRVVLPHDQKVACTGTITATHEVNERWKQVDIIADGVRDFAFLCSDRFEEFTDEVAGIRLHCLAFPEHEHYAREMLRIAGEAIPVYSKWFGPYPYNDFTLVESFFGWNGNECATLVMIDERVFGMPHFACGYVEYLISHETCHQWWYNLIGTNGYCETWMDEAMATYFSHRLLNQKFGINNNLMSYPSGLEWLPNIGRENYRLYSMYGAMRRGDASPILQPISDFHHVINLFSMVYDRGSKVVGMIENRMGEDAFFDFLHVVYRKYSFGMLRVADFQQELKEYTRNDDWDDFFQKWLKEIGTSDWAIKKVDVEPLAGGNGKPHWAADIREALHHNSGAAKQPCKVTVILEQRAEYDEQTVLGFCLDDGVGAKGLDPRTCPCQIRIPILPETQVLQIDDPPARVETLPGHRVRVEVLLPCKPIQIAVDPDQVLVDKDPSNNFWKSPVRYRITPAYTLLEETDLTNAYDRWNVILGPWFYGSAYDDVWYSRSTMFGIRAGLYRTQEFKGGVYAAYRSDFNDFVVGADGLWDHWPLPHTQVGFNFEKRVAKFVNEDSSPSRASVFGRYVLEYGSSLYLPPIEFIETFGVYQENFLPFPRNQLPGATRYDNETMAGLHYHRNYLTPYWSPEGGYQIDVTYAGGVGRFESDDKLQSVNKLNELKPVHQFTGQVSAVKCLPDCSGWVDEETRFGRCAGPILHYLADTQLALRLYGGAALPSNSEAFPLGGSELFRGFDQQERQGSLVWVGSVEWRFPLARDLTWDFIDHVMGVRNIQGAAFYDVGDAYVKGQSYGPVAHAVGAGLRIDVSWVGFVERSMLRFDVAKTVNVDSPVQFWFGIVTPF